MKLTFLFIYLHWVKKNVCIKKNEPKAVEVGKNVDKSEETLRKKHVFFCIQRTQNVVNVIQKKKTTGFFSNRNKFCVIFSTESLQ